MNATALISSGSLGFYHDPATDDAGILASDGQFEIRLAADAKEVASALKLRHRVFNIEMGVSPDNPAGFEFDHFDLRCKHLLAIDRATGEVIGTYRLNTMETKDEPHAFYSFSEFTIEDLPRHVLTSGIEIGRACVAARHRGSKALFLLWKGLARHLSAIQKRYIFGCCSIFTDDPAIGAYAYRQLKACGGCHASLRVQPRENALELSGTNGDKAVELPPLFEMYLRIGARICSPPIYDPKFRSVDFFVVLDLEDMDPRYKRIIFD